MNRVAGPVHGLPGRTAAGAETAACNLFGLLWEGLADLLGTAATATLLRRAALRGTARNADLAGLVIQRHGLAWVYTCPPAWRASSDDLRGLRVLIGELRPILVEMTGPVVVRHLEQIRELRERGLLAPREEPR
jgi:hypothetical protein